MPGQGEGGAYREISSCSVCGDFQARRLDARYRGPDNKPRFVHTLNGSGTAVGRALIGVMETTSRKTARLPCPTCQPDMGGVKVIEKLEALPPVRRYCERSEAIQSRNRRLDCFVALLLAMTVTPVRLTG